MTRAQKRDWVELAATVLLAFAAVATAWSSYQATRWNGEQAKTSGRVNKTRIEAARAAGLANAQQQVDVATFMQWVDSYARGETKLVTSTATASGRSSSPRSRPGSRRSRSRPRRAADALRDAGVPAGGQGRGRAARPDGRGVAAEVRRDIQRSTNYVLGVVLFAVALFFAGMSTKLTAPGLRKTMLVVGCAVFLGTVVWIATFPVSVSI